MKMQQVISNVYLRQAEFALKIFKLKARKIIHARLYNDKSTGLGCRYKKRYRYICTKINKLQIVAWVIFTIRKFEILHFILL